METIHIACGQFVADPGNRGANIQAIIRLSEEAAARNADLIVFPEMAVTGYLPPSDMPALAEPADGDSFHTLADVARRLGIAIAYGYPELVVGEQKKRNTFTVIGKTGEEICRYRKVHLWDTEAEWCDPGEEIPLFDLQGVRFSGWICYDTRFPEMARLEFLAGAEVCLVPTAWLGPVEEWEISLRARALDNTMFVAGSDIINPLVGLECKGASMIVDPHGAVLTRAPLGQECVIDAVLDPATFAGQRSRLPLSRDRVPSFYQKLTDD